MSETQATSDAHAPRPAAGARKVIAFLGVVIVMLFGALDQTIIGTAMPRILADIGGIEHYAWIVTAYMLTSTICIPIFARLSDIHGRRALFLYGISIFLLGSLLAGMSTSILMMSLTRAFQGIGAGAALALGPAIIGDMYPPAERAKWHGLLAMVGGLVVMGGPTIGGYITDHWSWRWIFYINVPFGAVGLAMCWYAMPRLPSKSERRIDMASCVLLAAFLVPMLLVLSWGGSQYAWTSAPILGLAVVTALCGVTLAVVLGRVDEGVISLSLFSNGVYTASIAAVLLSNFALYGATVYLPLFVQAVLGKSATDSGVVLTPLLLSFILSAIVSTQVASRTRQYRILVMLMFLVGGVGLVLSARMDQTTSMGSVARNIFITGLGLGGLTTIFTIVVQNAIPGERLGEGTGGIQLFRNIGGMLGIAILGAVMTQRFESNLARVLSPEQLAQLGSSPGVALMGASAESSGAVAEPLGPLRPLIHESLASAFPVVFYTGAGALFVGLLLAVFMREIPLANIRKDAM